MGVSRRSENHEFNKPRPNFSCSVLGEHDESSRLAVSTWACVRSFGGTVFVASFLFCAFERLRYTLRQHLKKTAGHRGVARWRAPRGHCTPRLLVRRRALSAYPGGTSNTPLPSEGPKKWACNYISGPQDAPGPNKRKLLYFGAA